MYDYLNPAERQEAAWAVQAHSLKAPFYSRKYKALGDAPGGGAWQKLPILTRKELYDHTYPRSTDMLTQPVEGMIVSSTGGTSGVARYTVFTHEEWDLFCSMQAESFRLMGVGPGDRVANLFVAGHLWPSFLGAHEMIKLVGAVHLPISANIPPEEAMKLCLEFDPTVIISLPTMFVFLADLAVKLGERPSSLRLAAFAGEQLSRQAEGHVKRHLGGPEIRSLAYTSADCGLMGYQCPDCGFGVYHLPSAFQFLEIVDPNDLSPLAAGQQGEVLVTNLGRLSLPIIRYRLGDLAAFLPEPCPCGDPNPLYRLAGRAGEDFKLGGAYISMGQFETALAEFSDLVSLNFTVQVADVKNQMDIILMVEAPDTQAAKRSEADIRLAVEKNIAEIPTGLQMGYIRKWELRIAELGELPRNPNTGKIIRLLDDRVK